MSYAKTSIPNLENGETGITLDSGQHVAVACDISRDGTTQNLVFHATARQVSMAGNQVSDAKGLPIRVEFKYSSPQAQVDAMGSDAIARDCMLLVMGEPTQLPFGDEMASASIRNAIAQAAKAKISTSNLL